MVVSISRAGNSTNQRGLCSSTGLRSISLVHAPEESFRTGVFDALEGTRDGCLLGEPICRRPILLGPAPPRRPSVRRPVPTRPWYRVPTIQGTETPSCSCPQAMLDRLFLLKTNSSSMWATKRILPMVLHFEFQTILNRNVNMKTLNPKP